MLKCSVHGPVHTRISYISGGRGPGEGDYPSLPPPPTLDYNTQGCLAALLPLRSHKKNGRCGHEKYSGMLLILAQAGPLNLALLPPPAFHAVYMYIPAPCSLVVY